MNHAQYNIKDSEEQCHRKLEFLRCDKYKRRVLVVVLHFRANNIETAFDNSMSYVLLAFRSAAVVRTTRSWKSAKIAEDEKRRLQRCLESCETSNLYFQCNIKTIAIAQSSPDFFIKSQTV